MGQEKAKEQAITARLVEGPVAPVMPSTCLLYTSARRKAHDLKEYIDVLFDWFKLNSNEFALEIQSVEAAELTRNILDVYKRQRRLP